MCKTNKKKKIIILKQKMSNVMLVALQKPKTYFCICESEHMMHSLYVAYIYVSTYCSHMYAYIYQST